MSISAHQSTMVFKGFEEEPVAPYTCTECRQPGDANEYSGLKDRLHQAKLCFLCSFWLEKWHWAQAGDVFPDLSTSRWSEDGRNRICDTMPVVRIGGEHFTFGPDAAPGEFRGHGGRQMTAIMHDGRVITSRNAWHQGTIPAHWRDRLPDNAVWKPYERKTSLLPASLPELDAIRPSAESGPLVTGS